MQDTKTLDRLFAFLRAGVTPWHAVAEAAAWLEAAGYTRLEESDYWNLAPGGRYYVTRNGSSIAAWRVPEHAIGGWRMALSHSDTPGWRIKPAKSSAAGCERLPVEGYGGMIMPTWLDRPLGVAGRVLVRTEDGLDTRLVNIDRPVAVIPSLCIHFDRSCNSGHTYNAQVDMQPLYGPEGCRSLSALVAEALGIPEEDMVDSELLLTTLQEPVRTGPDGEKIPQSRGGKGLKNYNLTAKTGNVAGCRVVGDQDDVMLIENGGVIIRVPASSINVYKRDVQGVIVMRIDEGNKVVSLERVEQEEEEPADTQETQE